MQQKILIAYFQKEAVLLHTSDFHPNPFMPTATKSSLAILEKSNAHDQAKAMFGKYLKEKYLSEHYLLVQIF